jgi:uncharacterized protein
VLIEFSVGNFRSFKETVTFSMVAAKISAKDKALDQNNVFVIDEHLSLLKSAAIYGANASGKSNLALAILFVQKFIFNSATGIQITDKIPVERFKLSTETENQPSFFEIVFLLDKKVHRYGFEVTEEEVVSEWLYYVPTTKEANLFKREENDIKVMPAFKGGNGVKAKTRANALFLSVAAQFNVDIAEQILSWLRTFNLISGLATSDSWFAIFDEDKKIFEQLQIPKQREKILQLIKDLDLDLDNLEAKNISDVPEELKILFVGRKVIQTEHQKYDGKGNRIGFEMFEMNRHESKGTQKLIKMAAPLVDTLESGKILFIDEFDASIHPSITSAIISLFNSNKTNPNNAQLIFITHDTNLLSNKNFRRDQIWFTEKDKYGATHLYSLAEYKVRNDASFENDYIQGRYGAVPFIGDFSRLLGETNG